MNKQRDRSPLNVPKDSPVKNLTSGFPKTEKKAKQEKTEEGTPEERRSKNEKTPGKPTSNDKKNV